MNNIIKQLIEEIVLPAGEKVLDVYSSPFSVYEKEDRTPVTKADTVSDKIILKGLTKYGWPILSEESKDDLSRLSSDKVWIVDSLDGTSDFLQKTGEFSIMIGLAEKGQSILGIVFQPTNGKIYYASRGEGAYLKIGTRPATKLKVSTMSELSESRLVVSRNHLGPREVELAKKMGIKHLVKSGSNGIKMGLIAEGKADLFYNLTDKMCQWDACAPEIILAEAGGQTTNTKGKTLKYNNQKKRIKYGLAASNGIIHNNLIRNLAI